MTIALKHIITGIAILLADLAVYIIFGLLLMSYDDFYDGSKGEYWSLASMTLAEKTIYIGYNLWHVINLVGIGYLIHRLIQKNKGIGNTKIKSKI